jgi:hypothetical protein
VSDPGDLHLSDIAAAFTALAAIRRLALEGANDREIAEALDWRVEDVREGARVQGFVVSDLVHRQHLCPRCGHLMAPDGHTCEVCILRRRLERMYAISAAEHARELEALSNEIDACKQSTHRVRERMGIAPRRRQEEGGTE